jgi:hypothetical protein
MAYWNSYFDKYIKNIKPFYLYSDDKKKYLIVSNNKVPLKSNIFEINNNVAKQMYKLSNNKIVMNNNIVNIEYLKNSIKIDNNEYEYQGTYLEDINFSPVKHFIKIKNIIDQNKFYQVQIVSDVYNEYTKTIPDIYINKEKILENNINDNIYKYLIENKFIGLVE